MYYNLVIVKIITANDAIPVANPKISCPVFPLGSGFKGTNISLPGFTSGWLLKKRNFRVLFTVPFG
jgi:hypothetical protein